MTPPSHNSAQPLVGYRTNEEWDDLLGQIATMIEDLERLEEPDIRGRVFSALQAIDALHREALHRLVRLFKEGVLEQVATDPAIRTLLEMYDLLPATHASSRKVWDFLTAKEKAEGRLERLDPSSLKQAGKGVLNLGDENTSLVQVEYHGLSTCDRMSLRYRPPVWLYWIEIRLSHAVQGGRFG